MCEDTTWPAGFESLATAVVYQALKDLDWLNRFGYMKGWKIVKVPPTDKFPDPRSVVQFLLEDVEEFCDLFCLAPMDIAAMAEHVLEHGIAEKTQRTY